MSDSPPPFPNLCNCINCHQFDINKGLPAGTTGTTAMMDSDGECSYSGTYTLTAPDGSYVPVLTTITISKIE
jgi:hypothetical protein